MKVYFIKSESRLIIVSHEIDGADYQYLFGVNIECEENEGLSLNFCKVYCQGVLAGNVDGNIVNKFEEFKV